MVSQYLSFHTFDLRKVLISLSILSYPKCPLLPFRKNLRTCFPASHRSSQITTGRRNNKKKNVKRPVAFSSFQRHSLPHMREFIARSLGPIYQETCFHVMFIFPQVNQATDTQMQVKICTMAICLLIRSRIRVLSAVICRHQIIPCIFCSLWL